MILACDWILENCSQITHHGKTLLPPLDNYVIKLIIPLCFLVACTTIWQQGCGQLHNLRLLNVLLKIFNLWFLLL